MKNSIIKLLKKKMVFNKNLGSSQLYTGFTLAEVLITLGIIGFIASMVIPTLNSIKEKQIAETGAKKAYSVLSEAVLRMQNDGMNISEYACKPSSELKQDFLPYFGILKDCGVGGCVPDSASSDVYKSLSGFPARADYFGRNQFVTKDGFFIGMHTCEDVGVAKEIWIAVDINGYKVKPNVFGRDTFFFIIKPENKVVPNGMKGTWASGVYCDKNYRYNNANDNAQGVGCTSRILQGDVKYW